MPDSDQPLVGQERILGALIVSLARPKARSRGEATRIVDVGAGPGRWGRALRDAVPGVTVDAVEVWQPYVERYSLTELYAHVHVIDARLFQSWGDYDAAILGDVLEHMPKDEARALVGRMLAADLALFLSIPVTDCPQRGEPFGNPYEEHVAQWTHEEIIAEGWHELHRGPVPSGLATIGTYWRWP